MIKYLKKICLLRITELAFGLMAIALLFILLTGGDVLGSGWHVNLSSIATQDVKNGMYVELEMNEVLDMFADDKDMKSYYYIIPYPKTEKNSDEQLALIALIIGDGLKDKTDEIMLATASDIVINKPLKLNGKIYRLNSNEEQLFRDKCAEVIKNYGLDDVEIIPYAFKAVELNIWDYLATAFVTVVLAGYILMLIYILSGRNEYNVKEYIKKHGIIEDSLIKELDEGVAYDTVFLTKSYISFVIKYKVYLLRRNEIVDVKQLSKDGSEGDIPKNMIIITTKNDDNYIVSMKNEKISKLIDEFK